ncbi:fimbrial biogenesis outer membrane usher protein (plasmid) [Niveispirillum cyanobacteriorum]|uniref:Fimbrial biogenesis outer membrane usher protein n=1 Tax=Niveispirillum cyanobacteriorum TaxID=1612173 RepID=A0A2K9NKM0_9PROT|nr:fimbrial biogenesis outer membrane usher protein [Niveispirillum cyanobacteriorum]
MPRPPRSRFRQCLRLAVAGPSALALTLAPARLASGAGSETPTPAAAPVQPKISADELFKKAFGQKKQAQSSQKADLPVYFDGYEIGQVPGQVSINPADTLVDLNKLSELLRPIAQEEPIKALLAQAGPDGNAAPARMTRSGIQLAYDGGDQIVKVTVPAAARRPRDLSVLERGAAARAYTVIPQADLSAQMNMRAAIEYLSVPTGFGKDGLGPLSVSMEPAINWKGWVVEGEINYREDAVRTLSRGPVRLIHDFTDAGIRTQLGDFTMPVIGNQVGRAVAGISVAKNFSIRPYDMVQPSGNREFILDNPSMVEVIVNGRPTRTFRLEPGPYNLNNFPGASGTNDVQIRITDAYGREQTIDFPFFFDSQLLATGVQEYGYSIGVPSRIDNDRYVYDEKDPVLSAYHRVGVTDNFTFTLGTQTDKTETTVTAEALVATGLGTFSVEPSAYLRRKDWGPTETAADKKQGYGGTLRYRSYSNGASVLDSQAITAQVSWYDPNYRSFGSTFVSNTKLDAALRISQPLFENLTTSLGGRYRETRGSSERDSYSVDLALRRRLFETGSVDLTFSHGKDGFGAKDTGVYLTTRFVFDSGRQSAGLNVDTISKQQRLDWRFQSLYAVNALSGGLEMLNEGGQAGDRVQGNLSYTHQRFEAQVRQDTVRRSLNDSKGIESRTSMTFGTALAFADGHYGVTRPITNSFAIITPHPRLAGKDIGVDPVDDRYAAQTDWLGVPIVPNISAYLVRPILLDVPDAPANYDLGDDRPAVQPGYKSGTIITIGTDAVASLVGTLIGPDDKPMALLSGTLRPQGIKDAKDLAFFTNRAGLFRIDSVRPGDWLLIVAGMEKTPLPITVAKEAEGLVKLGPLRLPTRP